MFTKGLLYKFGLALGVGFVVLAQSSSARADDWSRYYHWPYNDFHHYQWTPYEYEKVYDGGYRYPKQMREYPKKHGHRDWARAKKPYYRGHHFILDRF